MTASAQADIAVTMIVVIAFTTCVVLWVHERRWDRHDETLYGEGGHAEQLATLAGRLQSLTDFLKVDVHDARDDSPTALADTDEIPVLPPTEPMAVVNPTPAVQARRDAAWDQQRPSPVPREAKPWETRSAEWVESELSRFRFEGGRK